MAADAAASWLKIVDEDLRQVVNNLQGPLPSPAGAAYHCQQAAEKLVKAALVKAGLAIRRRTTLRLSSVCCRRNIA